MRQAAGPRCHRLVPAATLRLLLLPPRQGPAAKPQCSQPQGSQKPSTLTPGSPTAAPALGGTTHPREPQAAPRQVSHMWLRTHQITEQQRKHKARGWRGTDVTVGAQADGGEQEGEAAGERESLVAKMPMQQKPSDMRHAALGRAGGIAGFPFPNQRLKTQRLCFSVLLLHFSAVRDFRLAAITAQALCPPGPRRPSRPESKDILNLFSKGRNQSYIFYS